MDQPIEDGSGVGSPADGAGCQSSTTSWPTTSVERSCEIIDHFEQILALDKFGDVNRKSSITSSAMYAT